MPGINEINVNTVYQTVLSILNKEQRGYLTPFEFNNLAQQVQLEIIPLLELILSINTKI